MPVCTTPCEVVCRLFLFLFSTPPYWAAGCGCDAAPYFGVFNPTEQVKKFDAQLKYIRRWVSEIDQLSYPAPIVEHTYARNRVLEVFKQALG